MKHRAFPLLLELMMTVLIFSVAAAVSLRLFAGADRISRESQQLDRAVLVAQNAAETLKAGQSWEDDPSDGLICAVTQLPSRIPGLAEARIRVLDEGGREIFSLTTAWQEVAP